MKTKYISGVMSLSPYLIVVIAIAILVYHVHLSVSLVQYDQKISLAEIALQDIINNITEMSNLSVVFEDNSHNISHMVVLDKVDIDEEKKVALSQ